MPRCSVCGASLEVLLQGVLADPDRQLSRLPLMPEAERRQVLQQWNQTAAAYPHQKCLHQLFQEQVERTPQATAPLCQGQQWSYQQLNERANRLAQHLVGLGVGPESVVAICLERSAEMVQGLLAILKAGAAYLPLDPDYPQQRLAFMLQDARVSLLLTQEQLLGRLPQQQARLALPGPG